MFPRKNIIVITAILFFSTHLLFGDEPDPDRLTAPSLVLIDATTERVLFARNQDMPYPPASLTKLITAYLALQATEDGSLSYNDLFIIGREGSSFSRPEGSSLMLLEEGQKVTWYDLISGLTVASGNDAAYEIAHILTGDVDEFVSRMNELCNEMGYPFHFEDPDGWSEYNQVTPIGMAHFSVDYIRKFPEALSMFHSRLWLDFPLETNFQYGYEYRITETRRKKNTNLLLGKVNGVDGLKTGYIEESGFHFIATAIRGRTRLVSVVMGIQSNDYFQGLKTRALEAASLLEFGFSKFSTSIVNLPDTLRVPIKGAKTGNAEIKISGEIPMTLLREESASAICVLDLEKVPVAPLTEDDPVGNVLIWNSYMPEQVNVVMSYDIKKRSLLSFFRSE